MRRRRQPDIPAEPRVVRPECVPLIDEVVGKRPRERTRDAGARINAKDGELRCHLGLLHCSEHFALFGPRIRRLVTFDKGKFFIDG